jgi:hypothetical protein
MKQWENRALEPGHEAVWKALYAFKQTALPQSQGCPARRDPTRHKPGQILLQGASKELEAEVGRVGSSRGLNSETWVLVH